MDAFPGLQEPRRFFADVHRIVFVLPVSSRFRSAALGFWLWFNVLCQHPIGIMQ